MGAVENSPFKIKYLLISVVHFVRRNPQDSSGIRRTRLKKIYTHTAEIRRIPQDSSGLDLITIYTHTIRRIRLENNLFPSYPGHR